MSQTWLDCMYIRSSSTDLFCSSSFLRSSSSAMETSLGRELLLVVTPLPPDLELAQDEMDAEGDLVHAADDADDDDAIGGLASSSELLARGSDGATLSLPVAEGVPASAIATSPSLDAFDSTEVFRLTDSLQLEKRT